MSRFKRLVRIIIPLYDLSTILGLPGEVVGVNYDDCSNSLVLVLEGSSYPEVYAGDELLTLRPEITLIPVRVLLDMPKGVLAEENLRGAKVIQVKLPDVC